MIGFNIITVCIYNIVHSAKASDLTGGPNSNLVISVQGRDSFKGVLLCASIILPRMFCQEFAFRCCVARSAVFSSQSYSSYDITEINAVLFTEINPVVFTEINAVLFTEINAILFSHSTNAFDFHEVIFKRNKPLCL